jgi:hypothetical protein
MIENKRGAKSARDRAKALEAFEPARAIVAWFF